MSLPLLTPQEEIKVIELILEKLTELKCKNNEAANAIGLRPNYLYKAHKENWIKQKTFGGLTRRQIIDHLCKEFGIQVDKTLSGDPAFLLTFDADDPGLKKFPLCFLACSFTPGRKVAYRGLFRFSKDWKSVRIDYYNEYLERVKEDAGEVVLTSSHLLITVPSKEKYGRSHPVAWYCFPKIDGAWKKSSHFHGLYATFSLNHYPVSGEIVLKRYKGARPEEKIGTEATSHFQILLADKKLQVDQRIPLSEKEFWSYQVMEKLAPFTGRYMGYYLTGYPKEGLVQSFLHILPNGMAQFKCGVFPRILSGKAFITESTDLKVVLQKDSRSGIFKNALSFHLPDTLAEWEKTKTLSGIFSGHNGKHPFACRIRLRAHSPEAPMQDITPEWKDPNQIYDHQELDPFRPFLLGEEDDNYIPDIHLYRKV